MKYAVTVLGPIPEDVVIRVSKAHADAIRAKNKADTKSPVTH